MRNRARPIPYDYKNYQEYLADLIAWYKKNNTSLRALAIRLAVSPSLLSSVVNGKRSLTSEHIEKWASVFEWDENEKSFLQKCIHFQNHPEREVKAEAFKKMTRFKKYQERSSRELVTWNYLEKWWNVVLREMSHLSDFKMDIDWIRQRMLYPVSKEDIRKSLEFLSEKKLLANQGEFLRLECHGGVYKLSLAQFHAQMLEKVVQAIYKSPSDERHVLGHTFKFSKKKLGKIKMILDRALEEIAELEVGNEKDVEVYHIALTAIPLTKRKE